MRLPPRLAFWALAAATLLVSHDVVWLVQLGPGEGLAAALRTGGHGYWAAASIAIVGVAVAVALLAGWRTLRVVRDARRLGAPIPRRISPFGTRALVGWARLLAVVGIGFAVQENVEHYIAHGHVLGTGALTGPEYPLAVPVLAAFTGLGALVTTLLGRVERELVAGIAAALGRLAALRPAIQLPRPMLAVLRPRLPAMATPDAGRAPPVLIGR